MSIELVEWHKEFRTALFLSSLTLGTFLFTMKSFIIQTVKKEVYDTKEYQEERTSMMLVSRTKNEHKFEPYSQLKSFAALMKASILIAFFNAFLQISVGYAENVYAASICLLSSLVSWAFVAVVIHQVANNMQQMIQIAEGRLKKRDETEENCSCAVDESQN